MDRMEEPDDLRGKDFGYYVSDWIWPPDRTDLMKSMLLFFDGLALALPPDLAAETVDRDPILATPLADRGMLVNFDPSLAIDADTAELLVRTLEKLVRHYPRSKPWF